ncbi:MAG: NUDIX hydrolase [Anaerolineales bacterium]|nr:NUDIX hydrolase [Anaerolineales bacterium]
MSEPLPWEVLHSETIVDFSPWLKVIRQRVRLPNGVVIPDYVLAPGPSYSLVVPLTDDGQIVLVRQYKHGLGRLVYDFPAGYLDTPEEDPLACAQRELLEETGYTAQRWTALGGFVLDTNRSDMTAHLFLAEGAAQIAEPDLDDTEAISRHLVPQADIPAMLRAGELPNVAGAAAWGLALAVRAGRLS